jgi:hypothetical protein
MVEETQTLGVRSFLAKNVCGPNSSESCILCLQIEVFANFSHKKNFSSICAKIKFQIT